MSRPESAPPSTFPRGGRAGVKYRTMVLQIIDLICAEYGDGADHIIKHLAWDFAHPTELPWDGVSE
jgi:hypothetical protein